MKSFNLIALIFAILIARVKSVLLVIDSVSCVNMSISINATQSEFASLPDFVRVSIENQTQVASMPDIVEMPQHGDQLMLETTVDFQTAFVLPDGSYPLVLDLITSASTNNSVASFQLPDVKFQGCYSGSTSTSETSETSAIASASIDSAYLSSATATATSIDGNVYYPPLGVPTTGVFPASDQSSSESGLSSGTKIGITVGVLAAALIATLAAMAFVYRRWKQKQQGGAGSSSGSKARRYANGRWVTEEDRNSAELKEVHPSQV